MAAPAEAPAAEEPATPVRPRALVLGKGGRTLQLNKLRATKTGRELSAVSAIMQAGQQQTPNTVSKRQMRNFLAGAKQQSGRTGLTWVAALGRLNAVNSAEAEADAALSLTLRALRTPVAVRTPAQRDALRLLLRSVELFANLAPAELDSLGEVLRLREYDDDDPVIMIEGEAGEDFCIILDGEVDIFIGGKHARRAKRRQRARTMSPPDAQQPGRTRSMTTAAGGHDSGDDERSLSPTTPLLALGSEEQETPGDDSGDIEKEGVKVGTLRTGATFGELALLEADGLRTATAIAVGRTRLVEISRPDFAQLVAKLITEKTAARVAAMQAHHAFSQWPADRLVRMSHYLWSFKFPERSIIAKQGEAVRHVFVVTEGCITLKMSAQEMNNQPTAPGKKRAPAAGSGATQGQGRQMWSPTPRRAAPSPSGARKTSRSARPRNHAPAVDVAVLGPGCIMGDAEVANGSRTHYTTGVASSPVAGFMMKADDFFHRLDTKTMQRLLTAAAQTEAFHVQRTSDKTALGQREAATRAALAKNLAEGQRSLAPKAPAASGPGDRLRPSPRQGTLGLHISLGLCAGGRPHPIDPTEALLRDLDEQQAARRQQIALCAEQPDAVVERRVSLTKARPPQAAKPSPPSSAPPSASSKTSRRPRAQQAVLGGLLAARSKSGQAAAEAPAPAAPCAARLLRSRVENAVPLPQSFIKASC